VIEETTRVLLVEDDEDDYVLTRDLLAQIAGGSYTLDWVTTFEAALTAVGTVQYDVYLIDYRLGAYSGLDLLRALLSAGCRAPILLLTGQGDPGVDSEAMQAGAADYLVKGEITSAALKRALRHAQDREQLLALRQALAQAEAAQDRLRASEQFALATLDALPERIAILDEAGVILAVNAAWRQFGADNGHTYPSARIGQNYIAMCVQVAAAGDNLARQAARGIGDVLTGWVATFTLEYPFHTATQQRWFSLTVAPFAAPGPGRVVVAHHDVTARTLAQAEITLAYDTTIEGWSRALDLRDKETEGHSQRVTAMTLRLARSVGIDYSAMPHVRRGALLHDIGKMGIPDQILLKQGPLTEDEWVVMRRHPVFAYELLSPITYLHGALDIPYCHHERWDGAGYPRGLEGKEIPLAARLFAVVDVWDALLSDRPYRLGWPLDKVLTYIDSQAGTHFDPRVVKAFLELVPRGAAEL
jgi:putative nucleotidyltransferase with HDIG domain